MQRLLSVFLVAGWTAAQAAGQPNLILFLADDLGYGDLACYGHPILKTPNLDAFARQGMRLTQCYSASSVCSPSRSALLTGRTPHRNGVFTWIAEGSEVHLRTNEITLPALLKGAGYQTCHSGKWHLNGFFNDSRHPQPGDHGYDGWMATQNNAAPSHQNPRNFVRNGQPVGPLEGYSAPLVVEEAVRWLKEKHDASKPFFLAVWTHEPHYPIQSDPRFKELYPELTDDVQKEHHANVTQMDDAFGRLMKALDELKLAEDTFVFFTSDNGPEGDGIKSPGRGSTGGLRGRKRDLHEGGIRVPGLARWPGRIKPGTTSDVPVIGSDIFPTMLALAGAGAPKDRVLDGVNVLPVLTGVAERMDRPQPLYWRLHMAPTAKIAMRVDDWKILANAELTEFELYNLRTDPQESDDLKNQERERFSALRAQLIKHNASVEAEGPDWWRRLNANGGTTPKPAGQNRKQARRGPVPAATPKPPNLILMLADDLGYGDVGCYGGKLVPTPAIDSLARDGVRCTDGYVTAPVCAPSRCGLMTGAYNQRFGMQWNDDRKKYAVGQHKLLPQALRAAGYVTGQIGKWNIPVNVTNCFDEIHDLIDWEADYFPDQQGHYVGVDSPTEFASSKVQGVWGPERPGDEYLTDHLGRHAVEFIEEHKTQPFFLYLAFNAVHSPWHAKTAERERFAHLKDPPLNFYASMIASLDENVGRVLTKLKAVGLEQDTLVVFTSDNGPALGSSNIVVWPGDWPQRILVGSAGPLNGWKARFLEGGIREPFLLRWPAKLKAGAIYRQPVSTMDLYQTFCAAAGAPVPDGTRLDGVNLLPHLMGEKPGAPHDMLFWKNGEQGAARQGDWKLLLSSSPPARQLYHLAEDIGEERDLAAQKPELVERLHQAWRDWSAPLPPRANPARPKATAPGARPPQDRAALFAAKDENRDTRLSREEFLTNQADPEAAKSRFDKWDVNRDGVLSRDEFIKMRGK